MKPEGLKLLIQAGNPIISIETPDEPRATELVRATARSSTVWPGCHCITASVLPSGELRLSSPACALPLS